MRAKDAIGIFFADLHLTLNAPPWRSNEKDWMETQKKYLKELGMLHAAYDCPIVIAGDVFHRWCCPPELINFALENLPPLYGVPGQHDLPHHRYEDMNKSAYATLVRSGTIQNLLPDCRVEAGGMVLQGFPFGYEITRCKREAGDKRLYVAVTHKYIWKTGSSYPGAPKEGLISEGMGKGWDVIVYGDNHKSFSCHTGNTLQWNCGGFIRRKSDEIEYKPRIGILYSDGFMDSSYLDIADDKYLATMNISKDLEDIDLTDFMKELEELGDTSLDFSEAVRFYLESKKVGKKVKKILLGAMGL